MDFQTILDLAPVLLAGAVVFFVLAVVLLFWLFRRGRGQATTPSRMDLDLDVQTLGQQGPSPELTRLEFYNMPVRLAAIVIAPVGRDRATPTTDELRQLVEFIVPGLRDVVGSHDPEILAWPAQLSVHGFNQAFFNRAPLPGDHGKGTPWCGLAGKFLAHGNGFVAGLICRSTESNSMGQVIVQHEAQWMDILRLHR